MIPLALILALYVLLIVVLFGANTVALLMQLANLYLAARVSVQ
jgi:hypothetical protein